MNAFVVTAAAGLLMIHLLDRDASPWILLFRLVVPLLWLGLMAALANKLTSTVTWFRWGMVFRSLLRTKVIAYDDITEITAL